MSDLRQEIAGILAKARHSENCQDEWWTDTRDEKLADTIIAALPSMVRKLPWDHYPAEGDKPERWLCAVGVVELLPSGRYAANFDARYETLEDAKEHMQRRFAAKMIMETFGERVEP